MADFASPVRGKNYCQLIDHYFSEDGDTKQDQDVEALEVDNSMAECLKAHKEMKELLDRRVGLLKFSSIKHGTLATFLDDLRRKKETWQERVDTVKQIVDIVKDLQAGLNNKKQHLQKRRQLGHRLQKFAKGFSSSGVPQPIAQRFGKMVFDIDAQESGKSAPIMEVRVAKLHKSGGAEAAESDGKDSGDKRWQYMQELYKYHSTAIDQQAHSLVPQMKNTMIMKPLTANPIDFDCTALGLAYEIGAAVHRPWIVLGNAYTSSWGQLRWPVRGLPCTVYSMETLLKHELSLESTDKWFDDDSGLSAKDDLTKWLDELCKKHLTS